MRRFVLPFFTFFLISSLNLYSQSAASGRTFTNIMFTATLNGAQETPSVTTTANGTAWAMLSDDRKTLYYQVTYAQLSSGFTASHFHLGLPGIGGGVVQAIQYNGNTAAGMWQNLPDSIVGALLNGGIYVNVHSVNHPGGEIRGQLLPVQGMGFTISLDAAQDVQAVQSNATGTGWAVLSNNGSMLTYNVTVAGLISNISAAHFHNAGAGRNGGVVEPITFTDSSASGSWTGLSDANLDSLIHNGIYVNVHTSDYPNGEIRGQLNRVGLIGFHASLDGTQETPPVVTNSQGTLYAVLDNDLSSLTFRETYANLSGPFTASHFHLGAAGIGGGVIHPITTFVGNTAADTWTDLPDSIVIHLIKGDIYVNVHSTVYPGGEIRGQLWMDDGIGLVANINGDQDVPPIVTNASGTSWLLFKNDTLWFQITISGLSGPLTAAHFHYANAGENGGVIHPLNFSDSTLTSFWAGLDDTTLSQLVNGELYVNFHTALHPAGEIRGQVVQIVPQTTGATAVKEKSNSIPVQFSLSQNYPNPFNPSTNIKYSLPFSSKIRIDVYNILGEKVKELFNGIESAGEYNISFNAANLSSGVYFYALNASSIDGKNNFNSIKKMILLK